ncbi:MAG TPA: M1 family metallopeptidase [Thermoanaerobaculia bacterium]|jgi:alanyl aminopeptidase|nr:M1 family metallopeptidase [Thermoanaerobaculia bacterium]
MMKHALSLLLLVLATLFTAANINAATVRLGDDVIPVKQSVDLNVDPKSDQYSGSVTVDLDVKRATSSFLLHAEDLTIDTLTLTKDKSAIEATHAKGKDGTVVITTSKPLTPGKHTLSILFNNKFNRQAVGLYKMTTRDGEPYLFTQFQAIDARRAFPCWDEPRFKIPYQLTVTIPEEYEAISNTPVVSNEKTKIRFAPTKPLPSYLVALAIGKFESTPIAGMSVPGRVIAVKGQGQLAKTAAEITPPVLAALEKYFDGKHPFEKVDLIAVPEYWAGAMENPGLITFRDTVLLLDPKSATPSQRQNLIRVTAHELAHMWFGDLVTMEWWDDFWLNESFADWMGDKITDQLFPEFEHAIGEMPGIQAVMNADARATTDPIRKLDTSPEESMRNVGVAYNKGKAVLSMFEQWIGPDKFRQGVLAHIKANAWGNANASEFFASLSKHAPAGTSAALETFIAQPGIPLVTVDVTGSTVRLSQKRFSTSPGIQQQTWRVPVTLRYSDGTTTRTKAVLLDAPSKTVQLEGKSIAWIYPHAQAAGYYRWQLSDDAMTALAARASEVLEPRERLALLGNLGSLFRTGVIHGDAYLEHLSRFANDSDPHVVGSVVGALGQIRVTFDSEEQRPRFAAYVRRTLGPALARIGLDPTKDTSPSVTGLRPDLVSWLANFGEDESVLQFVNEQLPKYLKDPSSVHPTLAGLVVSLSAIRGDEAMYEEFKKRFETASIPAERSRFLGALGQFRDPAIRAKVREYSLTPAVRPTDFFQMAGGGGTEAEREDLYQWVIANYDAITKKLPPAFAAGMPFIAGGCDPGRVERARKFFAEHKTEGTERSMARTAEQVNDCAALRAREMDAVMKFLAAQ